MIAYEHTAAVAHVATAVKDDISLDTVRRVIEARDRLDTQDLVRLAIETDSDLADVMCVLRHRAEYMRSTDRDDPVIGEIEGMWLYRREAN